MADDSHEAPTIGKDGEISEDALNEELDKIEARGKDNDTSSAPTEQASAKGEADAEEKPSPSGDESEPVSPPEHWSAEDKEAFQKLDPYAREVLLRKEGQFSKGIEEKSLALKKWEEAIQPYQSLLAGTEPVQAVQRLLQAQAYLNQNPVEGIKWLMKSYGVEDQFKPETPQEGASDDDPYMDPEVKRLRQELKQARDEQSQRERQAQERQRQQQLAVIQQFQQEKDDEGNLKHPHFEELQPVMAGLLQAGRATDLEDAYQKAFMGHPEYIESEVKRRAEEQLKAEAAKKAEEARKAETASKGPKGKSEAKQVQSKGSWEQDLEENFAKAERGEL